MVQGEDCVDETTVLAAARGTLNESARQLLEKHLTGCSDCLRLVGEVVGDRSPSRAAMLPGADVSLSVPRIGPFELDGLIACGGLGVVYRGRDVQRGVSVAIKMARADVPEAVEALRQDAALLKQIDHPQVVRIVTDRSNEPLAYFAMDLIEGEPLSRMLAARTNALREGCDNPEQLQRLVSVLADVCRVLSDLHGRGFIHRDLSPNNIIVRPDGSTVLIDFGSAARWVSEPGRDALQVAGLAAGTVAYVAPEQLRGETVDARVDLYAIGCMLFQAITGRHLFSAESAAEMAAHHLASTPCFPPEFVNGAGATLQALTLRLTAKAPANRPGYAHGVARELSPSSEGPSARDWRPYLYRGALIARPTWMDRATRLMDGCLGGHGNRLFIAGESGAGKTRLLSEIASAARSRGLNVIGVECSAIGGEYTHAPHAAPLQVLRPVLRHIAQRCRSTGDEAARLLGEWWPVLAEHEPELRLIPGRDDPPAPPHLEGDSTWRLFGCLREALTDLAARAPTLLIVDDMQWADAVSLRFLESLGDDFYGGTWFAVVGAYRNESPPSALARMAHAQRTHCASLELLSETAIVAIATEMLAMPELPPALRAELVRQCAGNPFFVSEYLRMALAEKWLALDPRGVWVVTDAGRADLRTERRLPAPASVRTLIGDRLQQLSAEATAVLRYCAVLGRAVSWSMLIGASGHSPACFRNALGELRSRHVLELSHTAEIRFTHDCIRESAYALISADDARRLHRECALTIEGFYRDDPSLSSHAPELAHHWARAGALERAIGYWEKAGETALAAASYTDAVRFFSAALDGATSLEGTTAALPSERRALWELRLGEAHQYSGDVAQSEAHLALCLDHFGHPAARSRWRRTRRVLSLILKELLHRFRTSYDRPKSFEANGRVEGITVAASRLALLRVWQGDALGTLEHVLLAADIGGRGTGIAAAAWPLAQLGYVTALVGMQRTSAHYFRRARALVLRTQDARVQAQIDYTESVVHLGQGRWEPCRELAERARASQSGTHHLEEYETAVNMLGHLACLRGFYAEARGHAVTLRASARKRGHVEHEIWAINLNALCLTRTGETPACREDLILALDLLREKPNFTSEMITLACLAHAQLIDNHRSEAVQLAQRALRLFASRKGPGIVVTLVPCLALLTEVTVELAADESGLMCDARSCVRHMRQLARIFPVAQAHCQWAAGRLAALEGRRRRARQLLEQAGRTARAMRVPILANGRVRPRAAPAIAHRPEPPPA